MYIQNNGANHKERVTDCIKVINFDCFHPSLVNLHISIFGEQLQLQFESAMKVILVFIAACALVSTVRSAPFDSVAKSQSGEAKEQHSFHFYDKAAKQDDEPAREQHSFHFYDKAAKQDNQLVRDLVARAMESDDEPSLAEIQGWLSTAWNLVKTALSLYEKAAMQEDEPTDAVEQHSFHFYQKAAKQDDQLVRELVARAMESDDEPSLAEIQGWLSTAWNLVKTALSLYEKAAMQEDEPTDAVEQHSFHFYQKAAKQDDQLVRELVARAMESDDEPSLAEIQGWLSTAWNLVKTALSLYEKAAMQEDEPTDAVEQHSFHFYQKAAKQDDQLVRGLVARAMESDDEPSLAEIQGWLSTAWNLVKTALSLYEKAAMQEDEPTDAVEQHSFHFYQKAAKQDDQLVRGLVARAMESDDEPSLAEIQGWLSTAWNLVKTALSLYEKAAMQEDEPTDAVEQHSFHFYQKAAKQDDQLVRGLVARAMESDDEPSLAEIQGWLSTAWNLVKTALSLYEKAAMQEDEPTDAVEQHSFHFYQKAAKQDDQLVRGLVARAMESDDEPSLAEIQGWLSTAWNLVKTALSLYEKAAMQEDEPTDAVEQHSFHFYQKAAKQDDQLVRDLVARAMESDDEPGMNAKEQHSFHFYEKAAKQEDDVPGARF